MPKAQKVLVLVATLTTWFGLTASTTHAQLRRPTADLVHGIRQESVQPGQSVAGELRVELPEGIHVQSDQPREPYLIPTRLTFTLPEGVTVEDIAYPPPTDWSLEGQEEPLAVFESEFSIGWRLALAADVSPGEIVLPGSFQYQSCDDRLCYPPVTASVEWRVQVERVRDP